MVVRGCHDLLKRIRDVVAANVVFPEVLWTQGDLVLEVTLDGREGDVLVDVLRVGDGRGGDGVPVWRARVGVVLVPVEPLVPLKDGLFIGLRLGVPEVPEIIRRRVAHNVRIGVGRHPIGNVRKPFREEPLLRGIRQSIEADVLQFIIARSVVKCVDDVEGRGIRIHPPDAFQRGQVWVVGRRQSVLVRQLAIVQNVFRNVSKVDVKVASGEVFRILIERIHQPELEVFDVGHLKVRGRQRTLDAAPTAARIGQRPFHCQTSGDAPRTLRHFVVVLPPLFRAEGQIEGRNVGWRAGGQFPVGEHLAFEDFPRAVVALDLSTDLSVLQTRPAEKLWIHRVPAQCRPVVVVNQAVLQIALREEVGLEFRSRSQEPSVHRPDVDGGLAAFEIIDVRISILTNGAAMARDQIRRFRSDVDAGSHTGFVKRQSVHQVGQKLTV